MRPVPKWTPKGPEELTHPTPFPLGSEVYDKGFTPNAAKEKTQPKTQRRAL